MKEYEEKNERIKAKKEEKKQVEIKQTRINMINLVNTKPESLLQKPVKRIRITDYTEIKNNRKYIKETR